MQKFSELMRGKELIVAPVALNPIMARLAEEAGFQEANCFEAASASGN